MRRFRADTFVRVLAVMLAILATYFVWSGCGRSYTPKSVDLFLKYTIEYGADSGRGNVLGIQPYMLNGDYSSQQSFQAKMDGYLREAQKLGWLNPKTVIVLPEYLGAWLVVAGEKRGIYTSFTIENAMKILVSSNLFPFAWAAVFSPAQDRLKYAVFKIKAASMAGIYDRVFSSLARKYRVTLVAGSIILPSPSVVRGRLVIGEGPLYNVLPVYLPNGKVSSSLVFKAFPTKDEKVFLKGREVENLPVVNTPLGKLGVLICADAWYPKSYEVMKRKRASIVAAPSFIIGDRAWEETWHGYSGAANPEDVQKADVGRITEKQAWMKYALAGRLLKSGIPDGIMVCLRGRLWDLGSDGSTVVVWKGKAANTPNVEGAALVNLWL